MLALNCKEVTTLLAMSHVEDLSRVGRLQVQFHLLICYVCRRYERQIAHIGLAYQTLIQSFERSMATGPLKTRLIHQLTHG